MDNKEVVRVIFDGFNSRDLDRVAAICSDDFVLEDLPAGVTLRGPDGMSISVSNHWRMVRMCRGLARSTNSRSSIRADASS